MKDKTVKYLKKKKKFEARLLLDRIMEKYFLSLIDDCEIKETELGISYHYNDDFLFFYTKPADVWDTWKLNNMFVKIFNISRQREELFIKRMIRKHCDLHVK